MVYYLEQQHTICNILYFCAIYVKYFYFYKNFDKYINNYFI